VDDELQFQEPNGTYSFTAVSSNASFDVSTSPVTVDGSPLSVDLEFNLVTYGVSFEEQGLPGGATWWVNLTGETPLDSTGSEISASLPNGSYQYSIATSDHEYAPSVYTGSFSVDGDTILIPLAFSIVKYGLTIEETGLPVGTEWSVNLGGVIRNTTSNEVVVNEPNGTYSFAISTDLGGSWKSSLTVDGGPTLVTEHFYRATIQETGLPSGDTWSATVNEATLTSSSKSIVFYLLSGTYELSIGAISGFHASYHSSFGVKTSKVTLKVKFKRSKQDLLELPMTALVEVVVKSGG
jgi:hypothetical protein